MIDILRQSRSIAAHVRPAQMENAHAEPFNAFYPPLDICNRRHFLCRNYSGTLVRRGRPMKPKHILLPSGLRLLFFE